MYFVKTPWILKNIFPKLLWTISNDQNSIYLTFDDGPHPDITPWLLDLFRDKKVKASFFCLGSNAQKHPLLMESIRRDGHTVGNHSQSHPSGWETNKSDYVKDIETGYMHTGSKLFRPPYGKICYPQYLSLSKKHKIVLWDIMPGDFDKNVSAKACKQRIMSNSESGSIIVLHENDHSKEKLMKFLPDTLDSLIQAGYSLDAIPQVF